MSKIAKHRIATANGTRLVDAQVHIIPIGKRKLRVFHSQDTGTVSEARTGFRICDTNAVALQAALNSYRRYTSRELVIAAVGSVVARVGEDKFFETIDATPSLPEEDDNAK